NEIAVFTADTYKLLTCLVVVAAAIASQEEFGRRRNWSALRYAAGASTTLLALALATTPLAYAHPFFGYAGIGWALALASHYKVLHAHERAGLLLARVMRHA